MFWLTGHFFLMSQSVFPQDDKSNLLEEVRQQYNQSNWKVSKLLSEEYIDYYQQDEVEVRAYLHSSILELDEKDANLSAEIYLKHYPLSPHAHLVRISLADYWLRKKELKKAYLWFDTVEPLAVSRKRYDRVLFGKALCEFERGDFDKSLKNFQQISLNSTFLESSTFYQGYIYHSLNDYEQALNFLLDLELENAILLVIDCYKALGRLEELIDFGEKQLLKVNGNNRFILHRYLADAHFERGNTMENEPITTIHL